MGGEASSWCFTPWPGWMRISLCLSVFVWIRVENYTSENSDLWRKVENLETANRWGSHTHTQTDSDSQFVFHNRPELLCAGSQRSPRGSIKFLFNHPSLQNSNNAAQGLSGFIKEQQSWIEPSWMKLHFCDCEEVSIYALDVATFGGLHFMCYTEGNYRT